MEELTPEAELSLIGCLLDAARDDAYAALCAARSQLEARQRQLLGGTDSVRHGAPPPSIAELVATDEAFADEATRAVASEAVEFVREQLAGLASIKEDRPLSDEERQLGRELGTILDSLPELIGTDDVGQINGTGADKRGQINGTGPNGT